MTKDRTAERVAEILRYADKVYRQGVAKEIPQKVEDTLGPNPCTAAQYTHQDTGDTFGTVCDGKRCRDCGPRKQLTIKLQLEAGFGDLAYIGRTMTRTDIDRALETDKKKRQRGQAGELIYQIVGDPNLGFVIVSNRPLIAEQRHMQLRDWYARILDLYHRAGNRIRRSRTLGRIGLVPNSHKKRRESGTGPSSWHYKDGAAIDRARWEMAKRQLSEYYDGIKLILRQHGFSEDAYRAPSKPSTDLPVPY